MVGSCIMIDYIPLNPVRVWRDFCGYSEKMLWSDFNTCKK